jgi:REP element-mobilizing transposase RayT
MRGTTIAFQKTMKYDPIHHHRRSIRLHGYDYSQEGIYFVTICVQNRECVFGEIINSNLELNEMGRMVQNVWLQINEKYKHISTDHFILMPDHLHGIIIINDLMHKGEGTSPLRKPYKPTLGNIIAWFKYQSTKQCNQLRHTPGIRLWQRNYFEHIIRNEHELNRIINYISKNPLYWDSDRTNLKK